LQEDLPRKQYWTGPNHMKLQEQEETSAHPKGLACLHTFVYVGVGVCVWEREREREMLQQHDNSRCGTKRLNVGSGKTFVPPQQGNGSPICMTKWKLANCIPHIPGPAAAAYGWMIDACMHACGDLSQILFGFLWDPPNPLSIHLLQFVRTNRIYLQTQESTTFQETTSLEEGSGYVVCTSVVLVLILKRIYGPGYFISYNFDYPFG
jgi:hypothetical protein